MVWNFDLEEQELRHFNSWEPEANDAFLTEEFYKAMELSLKGYHAFGREGNDSWLGKELKNRHGKDGGPRSSRSRTLHS